MDTRQHTPRSIGRTTDAQRLTQYAHILRNFATQLERHSSDCDQALDHLAREQALIGWPTRNDDPNVSGSTGDLTRTERAAEASWRLTNQREAIRDIISYLSDDLTLIRRNIDTLNRAITRAHGMRTERPTEPVCRDQQTGKHAAIEWGDALCQMPGVKSGLCQRHYMAWYRARLRDDVDTTRDFGEAV